LRLGYTGASSFNRTFMRMMKVQPATFRRQHRDSGMSRGEGPNSSCPR
jgi:AraC-like DNA-binding protein